MTHPEKTTSRQPGTRRHLLSLATLADSDLHQLITRSQMYAASPVPVVRPLTGCVIGSYFKVTSTRTRTAFSSGAARLGATVIAYGPDDLQLNTGETLADTGEVMSRMLDGLVARTAGDPADLQALGAQRRMAVVNAMTADEHPTQAICDLATLAQQFGRVAGIRCLYVGEGNNTAAALALALARFKGARLDLRTPPGYGLDPGKLTLATAAAQRHGAHVEEQHDLDALPAEVDVIYTTRWQTTGTAKPDPNWRDVFSWSGTPTRCSCMICPPTGARRWRRRYWTARPASPSSRPATSCTARWPSSNGASTDRPAGPAPNRPKCGWPGRAPPPAAPPVRC